MGWISNAQNIAGNRPVGSCPNCGSCDTDFRYFIVDEKQGTGCCDIWCRTCMHGYHVPRVKVSNRLKVGELPKKVVFDEK